MKIEIKPLEFLQLNSNPEFESDWDYCLLIPKENEYILYYFNFDERFTILNDINLGKIKLNLSNSILFYLTNKAVLSCFDLGCIVAYKKS